MTNDLISRSELLAEYDRVHAGPPGGARKLIQDVPVVEAVEVVRCKDCAYKEMIVCAKESERVICSISGMHRKGENDFCSFGERKDNATD